MANVDRVAHNFDEPEPEPYYAEGEFVYYRALGEPLELAAAKTAAWARHISTALNHWSK